VEAGGQSEGPDAGRGGGWKCRVQRIGVAVRSHRKLRRGSRTINKLIRDTQFCDRSQEVPGRELC
jgi:hypothetical protein